MMIKTTNSCVFLMIFIAVLVLPPGNYSQAMLGKTTSAKLALKKVNENCKSNLDARYDRGKLLEEFGNILNKTAVNYYNAIYSKKKTSENPKIKDNDGRPIGFFVFDLTDTSNKATPLSGCINFIDNHVYHFALINTPYSFSHIAILKGGGLKVFKAINCKNGDNLEDVVNYLDQFLKDAKDKNDLLDRVKKYRKHGIYSTIDDDSLLCQ